MFKRTLLCALTIVITLFISRQGFAASEQDVSQGHDSISPQTKMEIIKTMEELTKLSLEKLNTQNSTKLSLNAEGTLRDKLSSLGVRELTPIEVQEKLSENLVTPNVSVPPTNSNVRWYELRYTHTRSGKTYDIQELYAQAVGYNTNLYSSNNTLYLINGTKTQVNVGQALINVYANKLIGVIAALNPITNILPYELFVKIPDGSSTISMNSDFISYRLLSTACFSYVKDSGKSDDYLTMTYASNTFTISSSHTVAGIADEGKPTATPLVSSGRSLSYSAYATDYASSSKAVDNFLSLSRSTSYAQATVWKVKDTQNKEHTATASVFTPSMPSQITQ